MKNITEYLKESLETEVSEGLLNDAAAKIKSIVNKTAKDFKNWIASHKGDIEKIGQAIKEINSRNKKVRYTPKNHFELAEIIYQLLQKGITDLNCIDTGHLTEIDWLFDAHPGLHEMKDDITELNVSDWDVSKCERLCGTFAGLTNVTTLGNLSVWDVSNVQDIKYMFAECGKLNSIGDFSKWNIDPEKVYMPGVFHKCPRLKEQAIKMGWTEKIIK